MINRHSRRGILKGAGLLVCGISTGCLGTQLGTDPSQSTTPRGNERVEYIEVRNRTNESQTATITIHRDGETVHEETFDLKSWDPDSDAQESRFLQGAYLTEPGNYSLDFESGTQQVEEDIFEEGAAESACYRVTAEIFPNQDAEEGVELYVGIHASTEFCG